MISWSLIFSELAIKKILKQPPSQSQAEISGIKDFLKSNEFISICFAGSLTLYTGELVGGVSILA